MKVRNKTDYKKVIKDVMKHIDVMRKNHGGAHAKWFYLVWHARNGFALWSRKQMRESKFPGHQTSYFPLDEARHYDLPDHHHIT